MSKHEIKNCPSCSHPFECKTGDIINCQCETVKLTQQHRNYIQSKYDDCLCANCMNKLRSQFNTQQFNYQIQQLIAAK